VRVSRRAGTLQGLRYILAGAGLRAAVAARMASITAPAWHLPAHRRGMRAAERVQSGVADISSLQQKAIDFAKRGDFGTDARATNEELTKLAPDNEGAWTRLARCFLEAGQLADASSALESALLLNPQNNLARSLLQEVIKRELLLEPQEEAPKKKTRAKKAAVPPPAED
jgi:tetratricopeptide (TPR) repeat protein